MRHILQKKQRSSFCEAWPDFIVLYHLGYLLKIFVQYSGLGRRKWLIKSKADCYLKKKKWRGLFLSYHIVYLLPSLILKNTTCGVIVASCGVCSSPDWEVRVEALAEGIVFLGGGGHTPLYGLSRYVWPLRKRFFSRFGHK